MARKNAQFEMPFEMERGSKTIEYVVEFEVTPYVPAVLYGDGAHPAEGGDVDSKEVWYVQESRCTYCIRAGKTDPKCPKCKGKGKVTIRERREELDNLVDDHELLEYANDHGLDDSDERY